MNDVVISIPEEATASELEINRPRSMASSSITSTVTSPGIHSKT